MQAGTRIPRFARDDKWFFGEMVFWTNGFLVLAVSGKLGLIRPMGRRIKMVVKKKSSDKLLREHVVELLNGRGAHAGFDDA